MMSVEHMRWLIWGIMLALTNGFSTLVSRARNTPSYGYHAVCATLNHGTWFVVNVLFVGVAVDIGATKDFELATHAFLFYTACSTFGSVVMHYLCVNYFEKGIRTK